MKGNAHDDGDIVMKHELFMEKVQRDLQDAVRRSPPK